MKKVNNSKKVISFRLYGTFGHFNQPMSNRFRNTYSIIPKPQLLGILGAIGGLGGYSTRDKEPEFYERLHEIKIYIKSLNKRNYRFLVVYNSLNSFLSNRVDSPGINVIINEQILLEPDFEIGLILDPSNPLHDKLIRNIRENRSHFPIYLGKNEFFANIRYIDIHPFVVNRKKEIKCQSILPLDEIESNGTKGMTLEMLPIGFDEQFKYIYTLIANPLEDTSIKIKNPEHFITIDGKECYVF